MDALRARVYLYILYLTIQQNVTLFQTKLAQKYTNYNIIIKILKIVVV